MVFGYIAVDVIQSAIANLHIDLAVEEHTQEFDEGRYHSSSSAAFEPLQQAETYNPSCNMPMWRATTLILGLHAPLKDDEELVAEAIRQEEPDTPHHVIHMQRHDVSASEDALGIRLQEIRPGELPLGRCDGQKEIGKCALPYFPSQASTVVIQCWEMLLVVTPDQHDTHQISKSIPNDVPIPSGCLRVPGHDISCKTHTFGSDLSVEELVGHMLLIQEKW